MWHAGQLLHELRRSPMMRPLAIRSAARKLPVLLAVLSVFAAGEALSQDNLIGVDWQNPEITAFVANRATNPSVSVDAGQEAKLSRLKLPVLGFDTPPSLVTNAFALEQRPALNRNIVMDEKQPVWYQITDRYGDLTISVEADLRIQQEFPADYPVYGTGAQGAGVEPQVSVFDERTEEGMEGAIAEYTVYKYPQIPYKVTIECTPRTKATCKDIATIAKDRDWLTIISARPPQ